MSLILIDSVLSASGERRLRKRRACRKCHRVKVAVSGAARGLCANCERRRRRTAELLAYALDLRALYSGERAS